MVYEEAFFHPNYSNMIVDACYLMGRNVSLFLNVILIPFKWERTGKNRHFLSFSKPLLDDTQFLESMLKNGSICFMYVCIIY